jgi:hypothetical protein
MGRTWEYVYAYDEAEEDTEHLITEYRPGGTVTFIAHDPDLETGGTVELVGMPWKDFMEMVESMTRHRQQDEEYDGS